MSYKEINISNPGTSVKFGGNDLDSITKNFNGVAAGLPAVIIKNQNKWGFNDAIMWFYNQALTKKTTIRGQSNSPAIDVDLRLPPITANDVLTAIGITNVFSVKQQFNAGMVCQEMTEPPATSTGQHIVYVDATTKHLTRKDSAGGTKDYDTGIGGGAGEANTASNIGTAGVGVFKTKSFLDLQFKKINPASGAISVTDNTGANQVDIDVPNAGISYAKIQNISATSKILGRITAGAGVVEELTATQATSLLNVFTSALKGLVPLSGGGTINYLRADGTWSAPTPTTSQFLTLAADAALTGERVLTAGDGLSITDGGAGGLATLNTDAIDRARKKIAWVDDMFGDSSTGGTYFQISLTGTGAIVTNLGISENNVFGAWQLQTGTTATGRATIISGNGNSFATAQGPITLEWRARNSTLSTSLERYKVTAGLVDAASGAIANSICFIYDEVTSANWRIQIMGAGTASTVTTTTPQDTSWHRYKIVINALATSVSFYIDGVEVSGSPLTGPNIPIGTSEIVTVAFRIEKSIGVTNRTYNMDYVAFEYDLTTPR